MTDVALEDRARRHVEDITRSRQPGKDSRNIEDLESSVRYLADELYRSQSHFLLELLQNADDNEYSAEKVPEISFEYKHHSLRIYCNEDGFTDANVEAICRIGRSTKFRSAGGGRRYIGEKGIGFKSVFKVANKVWISSGSYSFMFDRQRPLGMITPIWADLPDRRLSNIGTSMHLQLSDGCDEQQLRKEMISFDANTLIFLTRLREVNLVVHTSGQPIERRLRREDRHLDTKSIEVKIFENDNEALHYRLFRHTVQNLPDETKRPGQTESEIVLGFLLSGSQKDRLRTQQVFSFLPIRDCGFKFLIQADFLLVAGREDIDVHNRWNRKLLNSIPDAFANVVRYFNRTTSLRYSWLHHVPRTSELQADFNMLGCSIVKKLSNTCILESEGGQMSPPLLLTYVPKQFTLGNGEPLSLNQGTRLKYLSRKYSHDDEDNFKLLGVKVLDFPSFLEDLFDCLGEQAGKDRSSEWHSALATVVVRQYYMSRGDRAKLGKLPIIPLRDGRWMAANQCGELLFFATGETHLSIPEGMSIMEVHPDALKDPSRDTLFRQLGAKHLDTGAICDAIVKIHDSSVAPSPRQALISQAAFLFRHSSWRSSGRVDLWVATDTETYHRASEVYLQAYEAGGRRFPTLHKDYHDAVPEEQEKWRQWLNQAIGICTAPRLVRPLHGGRFILSYDMEMIRKHWPYTRFLKLLRDNWKAYSEWLDRRERSGQQRSHSWTISRNELVRQLGETQVKCQGRTDSYPLSKTVLPSVFLRDSREKAVKYVQVLEIPEPEDQSWSFLENLGVKIEPSVTLYLEVLEAMRDRKQQLEDYTWLYTNIQDMGSKNLAALRQAFSQHPLVFIPRSKSAEARLLKTDECLWSGPPELLKKSVILERLYPSCQRLFREFLEVRDADLQTVVTEALKITPSDDLSYIVDLFICLDKYTKRSGSHLTPENMTTFCTTDLFPIEPSGDGKEVSRAYYLCSCQSNSDWYIADRRHLRHGFRGKIPLLAFDNNQLAKMKWMFQLPGMKDRLLSEVAISKPLPGIQATLNHEFTTLLRARAKYIARLVPGDEVEQCKALKQLKTVEAYSTNKFSFEWEVRGRSGAVAASFQDTSKSGVFPEADKLRIYLEDGESYALIAARALSTWYRVEKGLELPLCLALSCNESSIEDILAREGIWPPSVTEPYQVDDPGDTQRIKDAESSPGILSPIESSFKGDKLTDEGTSLPTVIAPSPAEDFDDDKSPTRIVRSSPVMNSAVTSASDTGVAEAPQDYFECPPKTESSCAGLPSIFLSFDLTALPLDIYLGIIDFPLFDNLTRLLMIHLCMYMLIRQMYPSIYLSGLWTESSDAVDLSGVPILTRFSSTKPTWNTVVKATIMPGALPRSTAPSLDNLLSPVPTLISPSPNIHPVSIAIPRTLPPPPSVIPLTTFKRTSLAPDLVPSKLPETTLLLDFAILSIAMLTTVLGVVFYRRFDGGGRTDEVIEEKTDAIEETVTFETTLPSLPTGIVPSMETQFPSDPVTGIVPAMTAENIDSAIDTHLLEEPTSPIMTDGNINDQDSTNTVREQPPLRDYREYWQAELSKNLHDAGEARSQGQVISQEDPNLVGHGRTNNEEFQRRDGAFPKNRQTDEDEAQSEHSEMGSDPFQEDSDEQNQERGHGKPDAQVAAQNRDSLSETDKNDVAEKNEPVNISEESRGIEWNDHEYPQDVMFAQMEATPKGQSLEKKAKKRNGKRKHKPRVGDDDDHSAMDSFVSDPAQTSSPDGRQSDPGQEVEWETTPCEGHLEDRQFFREDQESEEYYSRAPLGPNVPTITVDEADSSGQQADTPPNRETETPDHQTGKAGNQTQSDIQITEENYQSTIVSDADMTILPMMDGVPELRGESKDDYGFVMDRLRQVGDLSVRATAQEVRSHSVGSRGTEVLRLSNRASPWGILPRNDQTEASEFLDLFMSRRLDDSFVNTSRGLLFNPSPSTVFLDEDTQETRFLGELYVSHLLGSLLGQDSYHPDEHWTSSMRSRNGHKPYDENTAEDDLSTFTISETRGKLRDSTIRGYQMPDSALHETCKFHIQVCATNGNLHWPFRLSNAQYNKAKAMTLGSGKTRKTSPDNVFVLARVYHVRTNPGIALYADPWRLHKEGSISIEAASSFRGSISPLASAMVIERPTEAIMASETEKIYHGLEIRTDQIRLLKLDLDGGGNSQLKGKLMVASSIKHSMPLAEFCAISYVWGAEPTKLSPFQFVVNDVEIPITESLWTCLRRLRRDGVNDLIWADAVCINQKDNLEKSMQVRRMGSLYSQAKRVIVWIGSRKDDDCDAIGLLDELGKQRGSRRGVGEHAVKALLLTNEERMQIKAFLQRPWFTRTWIIQELVFGSRVTIMDENSQIEWDDFMEGVMAFEEHMQQLYAAVGAADRKQLPVTYSDPARALHHTRRCLEGHSGQPRVGRLKLPFLRLVEIFFYTKSTKPRDKLFAMINLAADTSSDNEAFIPDYESDDAVILSRYAEEFVKRNRVLELLYRAGREKGSRFSSWIPDLMNHDGKHHYGPTISTWRAVGTRNKAGFSAGASLSPNPIVSNPGLNPILSITGKMFDTVQTCRFLPIGPGARTIRFSDTLEELRQHLSFLHYYPNLGKHWHDQVLIKMLIGDAVGPQTRTDILPWEKSGEEENPPEIWPQGFENEVLALRPGQDARQHLSEPEEVQRRRYQFWETAAAFVGRIPDAAACLTMRGYAGVVPGGTKPGDNIFLVHGASVPFVIRKRPGTKFYELRGECYIHGAMYYDGKAVDNLKDEVVPLV
ncbi:hypothetical protein Z517_02682 [Fonsecaea pedrosoi CBS 271.37]|uniref:Heterokaryon incompatibility domain-containing protein n=1 Tax=Fonsecaea pedrosoi CBS 271.37 TaxID=1442368 RepID=A0A0D2FA03_9EURO|nr:uncharacterized protein Z517_02682 [Fonsecaea pedrosoi CBS 271.37]KIW83437.1 hypothetical protein Z517_02682 [Fonsecaea pedrosoi CBS 271.37]